MTTLHHKEKAAALLDLLQWAHAEQYQGFDDDMPDDCEAWIANLEDDELCKIVLAIYHEGV